MTKIYHVSEPEKQFVYLTNPPAWKNISERIDAEFILYNLSDFAKRKIERDSSNEAIWVIEAAYPDMSKMSLVELRTYIPNGKIVVLGGDTIYYVRQGHFGLENPEEADLWLDLMDEVVVLFRNLGIKNVDGWMWTASETMLNTFEEYTDNLPVDFSKKNLDFVSFMAVSTQYRQMMVQHFQQRGLNFGMGMGCLANNVDAMIDGYRRSYFTLGSTSPSWTTGIKTMKGFRDWIGPALNSLLIYDDFSDIRTKFGGGPIVPLYNYYNFDSALALMVELAQDQEKYCHYLGLQKLWLRHNTLEKQFMRMFKKYGILTNHSERLVEVAQ